MDLLVDKLNEKLHYNGQSKRWFWEKYLSDMPYSTMMNQVNGYTPPSPKILDAIKKYLEE